MSEIEGQYLSKRSYTTSKKSTTNNTMDVILEVIEETKDERTYSPPTKSTEHSNQPSGSFAPERSFPSPQQSSESSLALSKRDGMVDLVESVDQIEA